MKILVTGGAGYIGSHFVKTALEAGHKIVVIDNLSRGHVEAVAEGADLHIADIADYYKVSAIIASEMPEAVVHFAAFAYVGESVQNPEMYYRNNITGSLNLIRAVKDNSVKNFVFSSTCSVYGNPEKLPISEEAVIAPINPYAESKIMIERILRDFNRAYGLNYTALRYFNAAGCDPSGVIGESHDPEPHIIPIILEAAQGKREKVYIYGNDYDTPDGTNIRDYIHVNDLARAHLLALEYLKNGGKPDVFNLGTGEGYSVSELIDKAREVTGCKIVAEVAERRAGDPDKLVADNKKAFEVLGWKPENNLDSIMKDAWNWFNNKKY